MFVADTNVLIFAADPDSEFHPPCRRLLQQWREQTTPWFLTWGICYEFLRVCTHARVFRRPWPATQGWQFLFALLRSSAGTILIPTGRHEVVLHEVITEVPHLRGNIMHDLHTATLMREHGISQICTRDTDFSRFPFLRVIDPLSL